MLRTHPEAADVPFPVLGSAFLRLELPGVEVHVQHAEVRFDGPAFVDDKRAPLQNDFLHEAPDSYGIPCSDRIVIVTVRLMGPYKRAAGITDDITLTLQEPNLGGVLRAISARFPDAGKKVQPAAGKIGPAGRVVVKEVVQQGVTPALPLKDGDRVAFVPIVGGGTASR